MKVVRNIAANISKADAVAKCKALCREERLMTTFWNCIVVVVERWSFQVMILTVLNIFCLSF